ncbi:sulfotransferase domain-containing protein [Shewanella sp. 10N.286.54.B9]|uniref:sulfotransferase domain-containing protein n=1 Tax=Shewanella sp. 10N.286.54.B9 TaxID=3229719 RepID=UPI00354BF50A
MSAGIIWLASYPKSGNTWLRSYIFTLLQDSKELQQIDINELKTGAIASSRCWLANGLGLDLSLHSEADIANYRSDAYHFMNRNLTSVAYHKIHDANFPVQNGRLLCPVEACLGALYVVRNPLDVAISFANHMGVSIDKSIESMGKPSYTFSARKHKFNSQIKQNLGSWSEHVESWIDCDIDRLLIRYEDMQFDSLTSFTAISQFLHLPSDESSVIKAIDLCQFDKLKAQEQLNGFVEKPRKSSAFFRKGKVGDWQQVLSQQQVERIVNDHFDVMLRLGYIDADRNLTQLCHARELVC